jgi:streptogramin lyase
MATIRLIVICLSLVASCASQVTFTEYPIPSSQSEPETMTKGPDGNLWFVEVVNNNIARITPAGVITEFPIPTANSTPLGITSGPDGNLWFTESDGMNVGRITIAGTITEFPVPTIPGGLHGIASGSDGNLWATDYFGQRIWRISTTGATTSYSLAGGSFPNSITAGPDGNLWFTELFGNRIGMITTSGAITEFSLANVGPYEITSGPDGNLWFTEFGNQIGRITTAGVITEFPIPTGGSTLCTSPFVGSCPTGITAGLDGNLWFVEEGANQVAKITTAGVITEYPIPLANSVPFDIAAGADGNLWFTQISNDIGKLSPGPKYQLCLLYDPTLAKKSGSTLSIRLELCDRSGNDLSSPNITLHATGITQVSSDITGPVDSSGDANPDNDFRFDSTLGVAGGYVFNLKTSGLTTGTYALGFSVTGDTVTYEASFQVR